MTKRATKTQVDKVLALAAADTDPPPVVKAVTAFATFAEKILKEKRPATAEELAENDRLLKVIEDAGGQKAFAAWQRAQGFKIGRGQANKQKESGMPPHGRAG